LGTTLNKLALTEVNPTVVAGLIYIFAGLVLTATRFSPLRRKVMKLIKTPTKSEKKFCRRDIAVLALVVLFGSVLAPFLFLNGLNQTTAINASFLSNTEVLFTVLFALIFLKEYCNKKEWSGIIILIFGAVFLATNSQFSNLSLTEAVFGNLLILAACLFWGIDNNLSKFLCIKEDLILVTGLKCIIGGSSLLGVAYAFGLSFNVPLSAFPYLVSVGAFSIGFSILFFMVGLKEIGSIRTGSIYSTSALFGVAFALIILKEPVTIIQVIAGLIMVLGVYVLYKNN
jgi:drug/metabolite transporter (DMT)-like permease